MTRKYLLSVDVKDGSSMPDWVRRMVDWYLMAHGVPEEDRYQKGFDMSSPWCYDATVLTKEKAIRLCFGLRIIFRNLFLMKAYNIYWDAK